MATQARPRIPLDQGLNLAGPHSDLKPGELKMARNYMYLPGTSYLTALKGRSLAGTVSSQNAITGLTWMKFRSGSAALIAAAGSAYHTSPAGGSAFASAATLTSPAGRMQGFYSDHTNRGYFIDGVNRMQVWTGTGAMRNAGLRTPLSGAVTWIASGSSYSQDSTFYYAHSEYSSTNDVESPLCAPIQGASTADDGTFVYTFPASTNGSDFDKYRMYKTQHGGNVFYRVGEFAKTWPVYYDGTDSVGGGIDNEDILGVGFTGIDDEFLSTKEFSPMVGQGLKTNTITATGLPPVGDIGGFFQGVFWVAGVAGYPHHVYWSNEFQPETFSPVNFMPIGNDYGDPVTAGGVANDRQIFFTSNSIYRLNAWPSVVDPGFGLGAVRREEVTKDHGCIAKRTVVNFGVGQPNNRLFYLSTRGPMMTDGYGTWPLHADLDWSDRVINPATARRSVAINYPKYQQVWLFCPSSGSQTNDIAFIYHYDSYHVKHSETVTVGKWMGPAHVRCSAAALGLEDSTEGTMYVADTNSSSKVYLEDSGAADAQHYEDAQGNMWAEWETGDWPVGGESTEKRARRVFLSVVGSETYKPRLSFAKSKATKEDQVPMTLITESGSEGMTIGTSTSKTMKTRTYRGGIWRTGSHLRFHSDYVGTGEHSVATIEIEIEEMGEA